MGDITFYDVIKYVIPALITAIVAYLIGSISFSIIITKAFAHIDVRDVGSGSAGATNVNRAAGFKASLLTFFCDFSKCVASILLGRLIFKFFFGVFDYLDTPTILMFYGSYIAGICCMLGHIYPLYFDFRGGKGVTTYAAIILMIDWRICLVEVAIFLILFLTSKMVSLGSVTALALHPIITFIFTYLIDYRTQTSMWGEVRIYYVITSCVFAVIFAFIIITKHLSNIKRILNGTESKYHINRK